MRHPDGKFEYCNIMFHVILKLSYECHNADTSSNHLKSILTRNEYTSLTNRKSHSLPTKEILAARRILLKTYSMRLVPEFYYGFLVRFYIDVKQKCEP